MLRSSPIAPQFICTTFHELTPILTRTCTNKTIFPPVRSRLGQDCPIGHISSSNLPGEEFWETYILSVFHKSYTKLPADQKCIKIPFLLISKPAITWQRGYFMEEFSSSCKKSFLDSESIASILEKMFTVEKDFTKYLGDMNGKRDSHLREKKGFS